MLSRKKVTERLEHMTALYENEGLVANKLVEKLEKTSARLAECERERDEAIYRAGVDMRTKYEALLSENRLLLERKVWETFTASDGEVGLRINATPIDISLTTAEAERVQGLERKVALLDRAWAKLAEDAEWECDCAVCAEIRALAEPDKTLEK